MHTRIGKMLKLLQSKRKKEELKLLESNIEKYLVSRIKQECDGMALKFVSPGFNGVPDRIIFLPGGKIVLAELKAPQKKLRALQTYVCDLLEATGVKVFRAVDSREKVDSLIEELKRNDI